MARAVTAVPRERVAGTRLARHSRKVNPFPTLAGIDPFLARPAWSRVDGVTAYGQAKLITGH